MRPKLHSPETDLVDSVAPFLDAFRSVPCKDIRQLQAKLIMFILCHHHNAWNKNGVSVMERAE